MSRVMKRYGPTIQQGGAVRDLLIAGTGKKLEVLAWWVASQDYAVTGGNFLLIPAATGTLLGMTFTPWPAGQYGRSEAFPAAVVVHAGDKLSVILQPATLHALVMLTYVEVDA